MIEISAEMVCTFLLGVAFAYLFLLLFNQLWAWHDARKWHKLDLQLRNDQLREAVADRNKTIADLRERLALYDGQEPEVDDD